MSVESVQVSFRLFGADLDPAAVTECLHLQPSRSYRRGDERGVVGGQRRSPYSIGMWSLESQREGSDSIENHVQALCEKLLPHAADIRGFVAKGFEADFFVGVFGDDSGQLGFELSAATARQIGELGADIGFDCYP